VKGAWVLQSTGLQVETGNWDNGLGGPRGMGAGGAHTAPASSQDSDPPRDQYINIEQEDVMWIHAILSPSDRDERGEGELESALGIWAGGEGRGSRAGTQVFTQPRREAITCSRWERCHRTQDRAGWALLHWFEQALLLQPILAACTWCGQPAEMSCDTCAPHNGGLMHPLSICMQCTFDYRLRGCRPCSAQGKESSRQGNHHGGGSSGLSETRLAPQTYCHLLCSLGPCVRQCDERKLHNRDECSCQAHTMDVEAEKVAQHVRDTLRSGGYNSDDVNMVDIGALSRRIMNES
jgi:hypothetical protein